MIILKDTDSLEVLLAGAVATNQAVLYAAFVDVDATTFAATGGDNSSGLTNNTTAVAWVAAPAAGDFRQVKILSFYNADTVSITVTVRFNNGTNTRILLEQVLAPGDRLQYTDGGGFGTSSSGGASSTIPNDFIVALGDETTALTTGVKVTLRAPRAMSLTKVKASLTTASTSGLPQFDVKKNGTSIFTTKPTIDVSEKTTETAATPAALSTTAIAADDELTFEIVAAGTGATGAKITLVATAP